MSAGAAGLVAERRARPVLVVAAMAEEIEALRDAVESVETLEAGAVAAESGWLGRTPVILARTGEGASRAEAAADALVERFDPALVVVLGISGALSPALRPGDLVVADEVRDENGPLPSPDGRWVARALEDDRVVGGTAISSTRILCTAAEKAAAWKRLPGGRPAVVDLESAAIARAASRRGIPYLILRSVSDAADEELPFDLNRCRRRDGGINRLAVVGQALIHPSSVRGLLRLRRRLQDCARELADRLCRLLDGESS